MGHKKPNDRLQALNAHDKLKWETAKEIALNGGRPAQVERLLAPEDGPNGRDSLKKKIDKAEKRIAVDSTRKINRQMHDRDD